MHDSEPGHSNLSAVYTDTAYDSQKPRSMPPEPEQKDGFLMRTAMGQRITLPAGAHCKEHASMGYLPSDVKGSINIKQYERDNRGGHRMMTWPDVLEWAIFRRSIQYVVGFMAFSGGALFPVFLAIFVSLEMGIYALLYGFLPIFSLWLLLHHINKGEPKLKKDTRFYRRTGMVSLYLGKDQPRQEIPFDEFDPYMSFRSGPTGSSSFVLQLAHRYSKTLIGHPNQFDHIHGVYLAWEELQQFMDVSQPLPDTVYNERFRPFDPVTVEFDRQTNRKPDHWRRFDNRTYLDYCVVASDAAKDYPWGKTREQALAEGWKPSEQRWQEAQQRREQRQENDIA